MTGAFGLYPCYGFYISVTAGWFLASLCCLYPLFRWFDLLGAPCLYRRRYRRTELGHDGSRGLRAYRQGAKNLQPDGNRFCAYQPGSAVPGLFAAIVPAWYGGFILFSTYSWLAAFSLFLLYYLPILSAARVDGQEG